jgi:hypothetical protein
MTVEEAQLEVRSVFMGGLVGQLVSGVLWLLSAAIGTWVSPGRGIAVLCVGGALIFPVTQLVLRAMGRPATLRANNPLRHLAMQIAFTIPPGLPLVGAATLHLLPARGESAHRAPAQVINAQRDRAGLGERVAQAHRARRRMG